MDNHYDIAIIGMGCAGSHVVLQLLENAPHLRVAILDPYGSLTQEKTWSFWEKGPGKYDDLIIASWKNCRFHTGDEELSLTMNPYLYKSIENVKFSAFAKAQLQQNSKYHYIGSEVTHLEQTHNSKGVTVSYNNGSLTADLVLDSRPLEDIPSTGITLLQHFKGWFIETSEDYFDPKEFTKMDYQLVDPGTTSFVYILPFSKRKALVEYTYFAKNLVQDDVYDQYLETYITDFLKISDYKITKVEKGIIPMTSHDFKPFKNKNVATIGTAGGWVKASTGYSFKNSERLARQLVKNYLENRPLSYKMTNKKYEVFDETLLRVLHENEASGPEIFSKMYQRNSVQNIMAFLDEESSVLAELGIMKSLT
ncbi:MAG: lycopene cyclase family protein, partial [Bacteroidota bacterium]|nr:lycopene cyclase family protein [Bacteroidota bacterium]